MQAEKIMEDMIQRADLRLAEVLIDAWKKADIQCPHCNFPPNAQKISRSSA